MGVEPMHDADEGGAGSRGRIAPRPIVATVQNLLREIEADPTRSLRLADLARRAGYSSAHLQRSFTAITGSSPKAFQTAARMRLLKNALRVPLSVTAAIEAAGFGSTSRLYEKADAELGMAPSEYRSGGAGLTISYATGQTPLGTVLIGATDRGICSLAIGASAPALLRKLREEFPRSRLEPMPAASRGEFARWMTALRAHLRGHGPDLELPVDVRGTAFQLQVWRYLRGIPYAATRSYAEVAAGIGRPGAARAVARACASNRVAILIPCHRVVRGSGDLSGYRWGLARKRALLAAEKAAAKRDRRRAGPRRA
jgi:AraC family transcriptional regulator of adaptative response/methylated-DNA-[protein]-cysteine methyltransferase